MKTAFNLCGSNVYTNLWPTAFQATALPEGTHHNVALRTDWNRLTLLISQQKGSTKYSIPIRAVDYMNHFFIYDYFVIQRLCFWVFIARANLLTNR